MRIGSKYTTTVLAAGAAALAIAAAPTAVADPGWAQPASTSAPAVGADYHGDYHNDYHDGDRRGYRGDDRGDYRGDWRGWFPRGWHW